MKKTIYTTMVAAGLINSKWQRVYEDENHRYYIRKGGEYVCISGTPAETMMTED